MVPGDFSKALSTLPPYKCRFLILWVLILWLTDYAGWSARDPDPDANSLRCLEIEGYANG